MHIDLSEEEVATNKIEMKMKINGNKTDARLIQILERLEVNITSKNGESYKKKLNEEELKNIKLSGEVILEFEPLNSNTEYTISTLSVVKQGSVEETVETRQSIDSITTLKLPAEVQIKNQFVIGDMIDFDVKIVDIDGAVLNNKVRIEVRDNKNKLVSLEEIVTNQEFSRKIYENLEENQNYKIIFYAPQYNEGKTDDTYKADYIIKQIDIYTEPGISGSLALEKIGRTGTGKNLIDPSSKVNWYAKCFGYSMYYGLEYNEETGILTLGGASSSNRDYLYDLTQYMGEEITISFKAKYIDTTTMYIYNGTKSVATINDLTNDWKDYSYTLTVQNDGYVGFRIASSNGKVEIQDLQIELGNRKTSYEKFKYLLNANVNINLIDLRDEIYTNDYYIRIYKNGEQIQELRYEEINEDNVVENARKTYEVEENSEYTLELLVKINDRYYTLDSQTIKIDERMEIKGISNVDDFLRIQPEGNYIVLADLDLSGRALQFGLTSDYRYPDRVNFKGHIDFNGYTVTLNTSGGHLFGHIESGGLIENVVFNIKINNTIASNYYGIIVYRNYGTLRNIRLNYIESQKVDNINVYCMYINESEGVVENFIINYEVPVYCAFSFAPIYQNRGIIRNGYIYGENIQSIYPKTSTSSRNISPLVVINVYNGQISNVYSLVNVDILDPDASGENSANLVCTNQNNSQISNIYSVGVSESVTNLSNGPNIYTISSGRIYNSYYFADKIFTNEYHVKGNKLSLWDSNFQNQLINTSNAFEVDSLVNQGYYPQLKMPEVMPRQEYIELPEVTDADLPDILSTKILEQGSNTVKVEFSVNNPSAEQIDQINIENMTVDILSQKYENGKSTVVAELKDPIVCVSKYGVLSITTRNAYNNTYTRPYEDGERAIYVDLYKEVWNINDWKNIADSTTENYMLMSDLDFANEGNTVYLSRVDGIINGNNHNISNVNLISNNGLIGNLYGELRNLNFNNVNFVNEKSTSYYGGIVYYARNGSIIDNVQVQNMTIVRKVEDMSTEASGGIAANGTYSIIRNCSVINLTIDDEVDSDIDTQYIGGIIGYASSVTIQNCYSQGLKINKNNAFMNYVGGILGYENSYGSIENTYAQGIIDVKGGNVGGIAGCVSYGKLNNSYSMIDISSQGSNIGGIVGMINTGVEVSENLSIGNIYTTQPEETLGRVVGNTKSTFINYAYEKQLINGYISTDSLDANLLSKEEISNLSLGNSYSYEGKEKGILPKLYNTEGTELLKNQKDNIIKEAANVEIDTVEAEKPNTTEAQISIIIDNPQEVEITDIEIEDMEHTIIRNVTQNGKTNVVVRGIPLRYYDNYKITTIKYNENGENKEIQVEARVDVMFYKEIYTYEDWQSIELGTYQNYRIMNDIDFSGVSSVKTNITANRIEAENQVCTLKNVNLEINDTSVGFIQNIKNSMKNIGFENITIKNTRSYGNYCGLIVFNSADMENVNFKDITVEAPKMSYVGIISLDLSGSMSNVVLDGINVLGTNYVGGLAGNAKLELENVTALNVVVTATGNYAGGIIGYFTNVDCIDQTYIDVSQLNITGKNYVGGIIGYGSNAKIAYSSIKESTITGTSYVGGMHGQKSLKSSDNCQYNVVDGCQVYGTGTYIGGLTGYSTAYEYYAVVKNSTISGTDANTKYVGGIMGRLGYNIWYCTVADCEIISKGDAVGGIAGYILQNSGHGARNSYVYNSKVTGKSMVGGLVGQMRDGPLYNCIINAEITATSGIAGGIIGLMENSEMTTAINRISMYNNGVVDTTITAPTKVGGLVGNIQKDLIDEVKYYYNNYIHAYLLCDDERNVSMGIGGSKANNSVITNTYVYRYSQINYEYMNTDLDTFVESQYVNSSDLKLEATYRSKFGWSSNFKYTSLKNNKYPLPNNITNQEEVDLPEDPEIAGISLFNTQEEITNNIEEVEKLPSIDIYAISAYEFNIDFSEIPKNVYFIYSINGQEIGSKKIERKTYTFKYNYKDTIEIKMTNGKEEKTLVINPNDVVSRISLTDNIYDYLDNGKIYEGDTFLEGEYVNLYKGKALTKDGYLYDIKTKTIISEKIETGIEEEIKPQNQYNYNGNQINVYGTYSTINGDIKNQIYTVKNGILSAISNNLDWKIGNIITDNYNGKEYQTVLMAKGEIKDIKEKLKYPENMMTNKIYQIVQNEDAEKTEAMIYYETGKVIVFNYVTGETIYLNRQENKIGVVEFIVDSFKNVFSDNGTMQKQYEESQKLIKKLEDTPIEQALEITQESKDNNGNKNIEANQNYEVENSQNTENINRRNNNNYITVYNPERQSYDIYDVDKIIESQEEEPISETKKIEINGLQNFYNYSKKENTTNGLAIIVIVIIIIITLLILLKIYIVSKKRTRKKKA